MEGISLGSAFLKLYGDRSALDRELEKLKRYTDYLEKQGIKVKFDADTGRATREVDALQNRLSGLNNLLRQVGQGMQGGAWDGLGESLGKLTGGAAASSGAMGKFSGALGGAVGMAGKALPILGQLGLAAQGLQAIFFGVSAAVNSVLQPLQRLSQEAGRFNQQVAEGSIFTAQSFAVLGPDGKAIEGTANQMRALRGTITREYREIQKEVAKISGATASEIYEGFNIILQNSQSLGERGEDLGFMRKLSTRLAAGMNTMGVPGYQLRSEVNALMMGNVGPDAMLAKKLGYDSATVKRLQEEGKFADDLMQKLEKLFDGQKVLSESLSNVQSNFADVFQSIASEGAQALERGLAGAFKAVLTPLDQLQGSFTGLLRGLSEAIEPIQRMLGELGGWLVSIGAMVASVGQVISDVMAVIFGLVGATLMPILKAIGGTLTVIAKGFQLIAALVSAVLRPLSVFLRVFTQQNSQQIDGFFSGIIELFDKLIAIADGAAQAVARPFIELAKWQAWVQGKVTGQSDAEIQQRQSEIEAEFAKSIGSDGAPDIRSLKLSDSTQRLLEERAARYGASESSKQLATQKEIAQLVQDRLKNEIQALEQGLKLMQAQKSVQEALNQLAEGRRGLDMARAGFSVQLAASPEARLAAEERKNDLQQQQEQQRINERRALLGTEREMLQTQLKIQLRQQQIQQDQLRIQRLEIQIQRDKAQRALDDVRSRMRLVNQGSPEFRALNSQWNELLQEVKLRKDQLSIIDRTVQLGDQQAETIRKTSSLEQQRLDIQGEQLNVQLDMANLTREQQATMARIQREEQRITNELEAQLNFYRQMQAEDAAEMRRLEEQSKRAEQLLALEEARLDLKQAQAAASEQTAEQELKVAQAQANAAENPTSVRAVIGAQIEALAAGTAGLVSEADATRQLYAAKERQLQLEQEAAQTQQRLQQERELSEQRILALRLRASLIEAKTTELRLQAEQQRNALQLERDQLAGAVAATPGTLPGAPSAPVLPGPGSQGIPGGARTNRTRDPDAEATGWDIVMPGGRGAAVRAPVDLTITGTGFQGSGSGASGRGYGNWISGEFELGGKKYELLLGHFDRVDVAPGMRVPAGGQLGSQGITGRTFGTHVTTHVNPRSGASVGDAWNALESITQVWERGMTGSSRQVAGGGALPGAAPSIQNAISSNRISLEENTLQQQEIGQALKDLTDRSIPELLERQGLQRDALTQSQANQRQALRVEANREILMAEVLNSSKGRLAGQLTEAVVGGLSGTVRGIFAQMRSGTFDLSTLSEEITLAMTERVTDALLNAVISPIEKQLTGNLFKAISGVDVEAAARDLTAMQQAAAAQQQQAAQTQLQAAETMRSAALGAGNGNDSSVATSAPQAANGVVPLQVQSFGAAGTAEVAQELQATTDNLSAWNVQLPYLQQYTGALTESTALVHQNLQTVAGKAAQASTGFDGLMQGIGGAIATLGGIAMAAGATQQMSEGGTYNTLMGLAGIFGAISTVAGGVSSLGGLFGGGGGASLGAKAQGVNFRPKAFSMPKLVNAPIPSFAGGGYTGNGVMSGGLDGRGGFMAMLHPNETVVPGDPFKKTRAMAGASPFAVTRAAVESQQESSWIDSASRSLGDALNGQGEPIKMETRVINGIEYATVDQVREATMQAEARGAERGRALTLSALKNSVKTRRAVGM